MYGQKKRCRAAYCPGEIWRSTARQFFPDAGIAVDSEISDGLLRTLFFIFNRAHADGFKNTRVTAEYISSIPSRERRVVQARGTLYTLYQCSSLRMPI